MTEGSADLRYSKPKAASAKMTEMVTTEVPRISSISPYTIRKEKVFDYEFFYRDSIQRGEGRVPIPVQKVSTQEL